MLPGDEIIGNKKGGHTARMGKTRIAYNVLVKIPEVKR
jgi:hypothetical protein